MMFCARLFVAVCLCASALQVHNSSIRHDDDTRTKWFPVPPISGMPRRSATRSTCQIGSKEAVTSRVFVHSLPRTATTSVGHALDLLGYRDCSSRQLMAKASFDDIRLVNALVKDYEVGKVPRHVEEQVLRLSRNLKGDIDSL